MSVIESVSVPCFKSQTLAVKPYIKEYGQDFQRQGKGPRFLHGSVVKCSGWRGVKIEFKQEEENPMPSGRMEHRFLLQS